MAYRRTEFNRGGPGAFAVAIALLAGFLFVGGAIYFGLSGALTNNSSNPPTNVAAGPTPTSSLPIFVQPTPTPSPSPPATATPTPTFTPSASPSGSPESFPPTLSPSPSPTETAPQAPKASFRGAVQSDTFTVKWYDLSTGDVTSWTWDFGDGSPVSNSQNPKHTYPAYGDYQVTLTVSGPGGSDSKTRPLHLTVPATPTPTPAPVAKFTAAIEPDGLTVDFTNNSTGSIDTYAWDFGDLGTSDKKNPIHPYLSLGDYTVTLTVTGPGGSSTKQKPLHLTGPPPPKPVAHIASCTVTNLHVECDGSASTGTIDVYAWNWGDLKTSNGQLGTHDYADATGNPYTVTLTVKNAAGQDSDQTQVTVTEPAAALATLPAVTNPPTLPPVLPAYLPPAARVESEEFAPGI